MVSCRRGQLALQRFFLQLHSSLLVSHVAFRADSLNQFPLCLTLIYVSISCEQTLVWPNSVGREMITAAFKFHQMALLLSSLFFFIVPSVPLSSSFSSFFICFSPPPLHSLSCCCCSTQYSMTELQHSLCFSFSTAGLAPCMDSQSQVMLHFPLSNSFLPLPRESRSLK